MKRKGVVARRGLKEAWSENASRWTRTGCEAVLVGRVGTYQRSPDPSRTIAVNPAVVRGRLSDLPREVCVVFESRLAYELEVRRLQGLLIATQKSAEGVVTASVERAGHSSERRETAGA